YSFSMLMWEICSGTLPFSKEVHSTLLSIKICQGLRPKIREGTPKYYEQLMKLCWDEDPMKRPTSKFLCDIFYSWVNEPTENAQRQFKMAEKFRKRRAKSYDSRLKRGG